MSAFTRYPVLQAALFRLELLDANGASATETDIRDWVQDGMLPPVLPMKSPRHVTA